MAYQTLECDRRGGLAARERREELSDPVPVLCDPIEVTQNLLAYKFARFWALPLLGCLTRVYYSRSRPEFNDFALKSSDTMEVSQ